MGLGPLPLYEVGSPCHRPIGGRIYCRYLAPWSTRLPSTAHSMCGSVPLLIQMLGWVPFQSVGWVPFHYIGLDPPSIVQGWVPF